MKTRIHNSAMRLLTSAVCSLMTMGLFAVPAYRGWIQYTQPDGTTIEIQQAGDEFYHYTLNRDGKRIAQDKAGFYQVVGEEPTQEESIAHRAKSPMLNARAPRTIGVPNLVPYGIVILVNYADLAMDSAHTHEVFDEFFNSTNCTANTYKDKEYGSVASYFEDQSNGAYRPIFDVVGPVTLSKEYAYYGANLENGLDQYAGDVIVEACLLADELYDVDFSRYDLDNDGYVDYIYVIYAGREESSGGDKNTIWPHSYYVGSTIRDGRCTFTWNQAQADGVHFNHYACSGELDQHSQFTGIGTFCHEFSHVLGLPDFYDTSYGLNSTNKLTPNEWDLMDYGSYNGGGHCPPNYSPWEKYLFGWTIPVHPGKDSTELIFHPNGTAAHNLCQVNMSGEFEPVDKAGMNYYIECRKKTGWDAFVPAEGMVIWKCNFDRNAWAMDVVNNTANKPRYTLVCSKGNKVGSSNGKGNVFPYGNVKSWKGLSCVKLYDITWEDSIATCKYLYDESKLPKPIWDGWAYYDDGINTEWLGSYLHVDIAWAVMFPAFSLAGDTLRKVSWFEDPEHNTQPISINIRSGGDYPYNENFIYWEDVEPTGERGFHEVTLKEPVPFDRKRNLWIILYEPGDMEPAALCDDTGDPNGRWVCEDKASWHELYTGDVSYTFMIRAYIGSEEEQGIESVQCTSQPDHKLLRDGQIIIYREGKTYTVLGNIID